MRSYLYQSHIWIYVFRLLSTAGSRTPLLSKNIVCIFRESTLDRIQNQIRWQRMHNTRFIDFAIQATGLESQVRTPVLETFRNRRQEQLETKSDFTLSNPLFQSQAQQQQEQRNRRGVQSQHQCSNLGSTYPGSAILAMKISNITPNRSVP